LFFVLFTKRSIFDSFEIKFERVEEQLTSKTLQKRFEDFKEKVKKEICSDLSNAFWHRKKHIVRLPYIKGFN
jgi:hypothetical protein